MAEECNNNTEHFYNVVLPLVQQVGKVFIEGFYKTKTVTTKSSIFDLVTEYDKKIEELLIKDISKNFPTHKFIGEETQNDQELTVDPTWLIDPIDGTTNFVHGDANCCISVALAINKQLELGIVYNPVRKQLFTAQRGKGAFLNDERIHVSATKELNQSLLGFELSLAQSPRLKDLFLKRVTSMVSEAHGIRTSGSCAMSLCYVAQGAWDAYQVDHLYCWDYSAGALLVQEAGGVVKSTDGSPFGIMKQRILAAGTEQLANQLVKLLKKADL